MIYKNKPTVIAIMIIIACIIAILAGNYNANKIDAQEHSMSPPTEDSCTDECLSETCEQMNFIACEEKSDGCKHRIDKGKIIGKCGVECYGFINCQSDEICENNKCVKSCQDKCSTDTCDGMIFVACEKLSDGCKYEINKGKTVSKCGVECIKDSDCTGNDKECKNNKCVAKPIELGHTRAHPASANLALTTHFGYDWLQEVDAEITLLRTIRGNAALSMIKDANMFNNEPPSGKEYLLAMIRFKLIKTSDNDFYSINSFKFEAVSEDGNVYDNIIIVEPEPQLASDLYPEATHEGWTTFEVDKSDAQPLMVFSRGENGELWFKLY